MSEGAFQLDAVQPDAFQVGDDEPPVAAPRVIPKRANRSRGRRARVRRS